MNITVRSTKKSQALFTSDVQAALLKLIEPYLSHLEGAHLFCHHKGAGCEPEHVLITLGKVPHHGSCTAVGYGGGKRALADAQAMLLEILNRHFPV